MSGFPFPWAGVLASKCLVPGPSALASLAFGEGGGCFPQRFLGPVGHLPSPVSPNGRLLISVGDLAFYIVRSFIVQNFRSSRLISFPAVICALHVYAVHGIVSNLSQMSLFLQG